MISRRWLIASGALAGLYTLGALGHKAKDYYCASAKWPANKRQLDQDLAATFSEEQRQLLKALAPFYDTFCFGDGRHGEAEIAFSFYTKKMMKFLFDIGVRKFFTEAYIGSNDKLSKFKKREMSVKEFMAFCKDELAGMAPADFENHALCVRKADLIASTEPLPEIIAADHRNENSDPPGFGMLISISKYILMPFDALSSDCRERDSAIFSLAQLLQFVRAPGKITGILKREIALDKKIAAFIADLSAREDNNNEKEKIALFYGLGHFIGMSPADNPAPDLKDHLEKLGRRPVVIAVFYSQEALEEVQKSQANLKSYIKAETPAVEFIIESGRVIIHDPAVRHIYENYLRSKKSFNGLPEVNGRPQP